MPATAHRDQVKHPHPRKGQAAAQGRESGLGQGLTLTGSPIPPPTRGGRSCGGWAQSGETFWKRRLRDHILKHEQEFRLGKGHRDCTPGEH